MAEDFYTNFILGEIKMKILKIESCKKCPVKTFSFVGYDCKLIKSLLQPLPQKGIHKDCPLKDASQQINTVDKKRPIEFEMEAEKLKKVMRAKK